MGECQNPASARALGFAVCESGCGQGNLGADTALSRLLVDFGGDGDAKVAIRHAKEYTRDIVERNRRVLPRDPPSFPDMAIRPEREKLM